MLKKPYTTLIDQLIPDYIIDTYPTYVEFIKEYIRSCEEETGPFYVLEEIIKYVDVSLIDGDLLTAAVKQYVNSFPEQFIDDVNIVRFIKTAKNLYSNKSTESSFQFIFDLLGGTLSFKYPGDSIFKISSSMLSGDHKIHDNYYYAFYVYEIETDLDISQYEDIVNNLVHPVGMKKFGRKLITLGDGVVVDLTLKDFSHLTELFLDNRNNQISDSSEVDNIPFPLSGFPTIDNYSKKQKFTASGRPAILIDYFIELQNNKVSVLKYKDFYDDLSMLDKYYVEELHPAVTGKIVLQSDDRWEWQKMSKSIII